MLKDAILDLTRRGDIVVDPFLGSGSTLMAADPPAAYAAGSNSTNCMLTLLFVALKLRQERWRRSWRRAKASATSPRAGNESSASRRTHTPMCPSALPHQR